MDEVTLTSEQLAVEDQILDFVKNEPYGRHFTLHGLAGTGKTTLMAHLARRHRGMILCAFTGKAASVLRRKVGMEVSTIHQIIFDFRGLVDNKVDPNRKDPIFEKKGVDLSGRVVLIDECSMVGKSLATELLNTGTKIVACGDPGQLPPVMDAGFFKDPDVELTTVHRQAWDSPIIRQAHRIRTEGDYEADGDAFRVIPRAEPDDLLAADVILCWRNKTRQRLNSRKRSLLGKEGPLTQAEPVMALKNDHRLGVYNGATYELLDDFDPDEPRMIITSGPGGRIEVERATIECMDPQFERRRYQDGWVPFAPAYAATVHKSQGSEWANVLLFDECADDLWAKFTYTGVTRASEKVTVVRWRDR